MGPDRSANVEARADDDVVYCARHPQVETPLRCGRCDTPICPRCLVQTPVGARCRDCAGVRRIPTYNLSPLMLARGAVAAYGSAIALGFVWSYILGRSGGFGFFSFFVGLAIGWAISEAISLATNRRLGWPLAMMAVFAAAVCFFTRNIFLGIDLFPQGEFGGYIAAAAAAFFAYQRLNR